jgi:cytochrome P450
MRTGQTVDLAEWVSLLALDFMGDFAYGGAFNTMKAGVDHAGVRKIGEHGLAALDILGTVPWVRWILLAFPPKETEEMLSSSLAIAGRRRARVRAIFSTIWYALR